YSRVLLDRLLTCRVWLFFFSSRRRHTRLVSDWSSDVCSSDLGATATAATRCWPRSSRRSPRRATRRRSRSWCSGRSGSRTRTKRSEEHTSELQSLTNLVCRLLLEQKKKAKPTK